MKRAIGIIGIIAMALLAIVVIAYIAFGVPLVINWLRATGQATEGEITYSVSGSAKHASVTFTNEDGGTSQEHVSVPWQKRIHVSRGFMAYVSAQSDDSDYATIEADILLNRERVKHAESSGQFVIASSSGIWK